MTPAMSLMHIVDTPISFISEATPTKLSRVWTGLVV